MVDCHMHCNFSGDSAMPAVGGCNQAIKIGLTGLTFTDHIEVDFPSDKYVLTFDVAARSKMLTKLQKQFAGNLKILQGVELGYQAHVVPQLVKIASNPDFDFVLMSVHAVDRCDVSESSYFQGKTKEQAFRRYLEEVYDSVCKQPNYDSVGHIGYIRRYGPYADRSMCSVDFADLIDTILKRIIADGKGIEVNMSGYRQNLGGPIPSYDIVQRYCELGGEIITLGSDSHQVENIGHSFELAVQALRALGVKKIAYFVQRKPVFIFI